MTAQLNTTQAQNQIKKANDKPYIIKQSKINYDKNK